MLEIRTGPRVRGKVGSRELIPALLAELERLDENARAVGTTRAIDIKRALTDRRDFFESEEAELVLEDLLCALSDCAGDPRLFFGRRALDSDEFGFWPSED